MANLLQQRGDSTSRQVSYVASLARRSRHAYVLSRSLTKTGATHLIDELKGELGI